MSLEDKTCYFFLSPLDCDCFTVLELYENIQVHRPWQNIYICEISIHFNLKTIYNGYQLSDLPFSTCSWYEMFICCVLQPKSTTLVCSVV